LVLALPAFAGCSPNDLSTDARLRLAQAFEQSAGGNGELSYAVLREAAQRSPRDAATQERLAAAAERSNQPTEALMAMRAAVAAQPTFPRLLALGRLELRTGDPAEAVNAYSRAVSEQPRSIEALSGLGLGYDILRQHGDAQTVYLRGLAIAPGDWALRSNLGLSQLMSGQRAAAIGTLGEAEFDPTAPRRARHNLALALAADGQHARVVRLLRTDMGPTEAETLAQQFRGFATWLDQRGPVAGSVAAAQRTAAPAAAAAAAPAAAPAPLPGEVRASDLPPAAAPMPSGPTSPDWPGGPVIRMEPVDTPEPQPRARPRPQRRVDLEESLPGGAPPDPVRLVAAPVLGPSLVAASPGGAATFPPPPARASDMTTAPAVEPARAGDIATPARAGDIARPAAAAASPLPGDYQVQLVAAGSEAQAQAEWDHLAARHPGLLAERAPSIQRFQRPDGTTVWRLRTGGFADPTSAQAFCLRLRAAGASCWVAQG
jgi:Flp pilus assembly protein TadD